MPSDHESVAIAQTVFYAPTIPITIYLLVKNWPIAPAASRTTWFTLALLSLMRLAGGVLVIRREYDPFNLGLTIATVVLLNVGLIPLIMATLGMIGIALSSSNAKNNPVHKVMIVIRVLFVAACTLLIAGAIASLNGKPAGDSCVQAAYIIFTAITSIIIAVILYLRLQKSKLAPASLTYLFGTTLAIPFLILRMLYAVFTAFLAPITWSSLFGSALAFALMALLPEYIAIGIYVYLGFYRIRENAVRSGEAFGNGGDQSHTRV